MPELEISALQDVESLFKTSSDETKAWEAAIPGLNSIVIKSSQNDTYRRSLSGSEGIWRLISSCFDIAYVKPSHDQPPVVRYWYLRLLRGVVLLARNLCIDSQDFPQRLMIQDKAMKAFNSLGATFAFDEIEVALYKTILEFISNLTMKAVLYEPKNSNLVAQFLCYPTKGLEDENLFAPYALLLRNLTGHTDFVFDFLKLKESSNVLYDFLLKTIAYRYTEIPAILRGTSQDDVELSTLSSIILSVFRNICCHESFSPFLSELEVSNPKAFLEYLAMAQLLATSIESWNKFELTTIMSWCFVQLKSMCEEVKTYFERNVEDESRAKFLHDKMLVVLDILATLAKFEHVRKFLLSYNGLELLVSLLHVFQTNLLRVNVLKQTTKNSSSFKITNGRGEKVWDEALIQSRLDLTNGAIKPTNFPECKSLVIEVLGFLVYSNKQAQDMVRDLQGLEAVLSNCVIDDNDPFIKERSIMCIKHLLQDNDENQKIVAQLESKTAVQDEALSSAGYQINVGDDGKVQLARPQG
ncbi:LADA_0E13916g1_1 [Lachancea dasiensis]|uniref:Ataxin-10 homolog n=1 Tax=Lachancea dasiensis TaxID=1072105 RepID=A0A1G4JG55_9SACH|nr:LADA_0E13916g1_1 [Lachancea dasiensis]